MLAADIQRYPDRILQKHFIMRDQILLCTYELQRNGGKITPEIHARAEEVIRIYREHFLGKGHFTNSDPVTYYSQACALLGIGFDTVFQVSADKYDAKPNGVLKARFASMDDFMIETAHRVKEASQQFNRPYY